MPVTSRARAMTSLRLERQQRRCAPPYDFVQYLDSSTELEGDRCKCSNSTCGQVGHTISSIAYGHAVRR